MFDANLESNFIFQLLILFKLFTLLLLKLENDENYFNRPF